MAENTLTPLRGRRGLCAGAVGTAAMTAWRGFE